MSNAVTGETWIYRLIGNKILMIELRRQGGSNWDEGEKDKHITWKRRDVRKIRWGG